MIDRLLISLLLSLPLIGAYAINALGIVVVYRASKVLNLAHGALGMLAAFSAYQLLQARVPRPLALLGGVLFSVLLSLLIERLFVRRLRSEGPTAQTIGTVAAFGVMVALAGRIWGTTPRASVPVFPESSFRVSKSFISYGQVGLFLSMLLVAGVLFILFQRTDIGLILRGTSENRLAASLMGVDPDRMTQLAWAMGGALAGIAGVMLAAIGSLHPYNLALGALPAFVAALLGGMGSLPGAVGGAAVVGLVQGLLPLTGRFSETEGISQLVIAVLALVVLGSRGARLVAGESASVGSEGQLTTRRRISGRAKLMLSIVGLALIALPWAPFLKYSVLGNMNTAAIFTVVTVSLVLLTGWVGQISIAHATFVGIGAFVTGVVASVLHVPFPLNLPIAVVAAGIMAGILGVVSLRVRGLYLAVATLIFAWMGERFLFRQNWLTDYAAVFLSPLGREGSFLNIDLTDRRIFFYVAWGTALATILLVANLKDTKTGRAFFAIRGSEIAAASLGIDVTKYKLLAFVVSGALAGAAGNLIMISSRAVVSDQFRFPISLFFLSILVVGGTRSIGGAVGSAILFAAIQQLFISVRALGAYFEVVSALLLAVVLLLYQRGLAGIPQSLAPLRRRVRKVFEKPAEIVGTALSALSFPVRVLASVVSKIRISRPQLRLILRRKKAASPAPAAAAVATEPAVSDNGKSPPAFDAASLPKDRSERAAVLEAVGVSVQFGGLKAVDDVSLAVREGEIVGLIGPNGAGKTTTFNAISGLNNPTSGRIYFQGDEITNLQVHRRAALGMGRTFQLIQLFPQLTVFENILVATHLHNPSGVISGAIAARKCLLAETSERARVRDVIELLKLQGIADRPVAGLPFGVLRMVEVGRALATEPKLIMLDEPASGLDNTETDRLSELLFFIRGLGIAILVIEHDVRMVTGVSDYMYVLDRGALLAQGTPLEIRRNPEVVAAYLGQAHEEKVPA